MRPSAYPTAGQIRQFRIALHDSQQDFAVRLGVATSAVSRWERGVHRPVAALVMLMRLVGQAEDVRVPWERSHG